MASTSEPSSTATELAAHAHGVSFTYPGGRVALRAVSARFASGRVSAIVGPNGSGKSTLLAMIGRRVRASTGRVEYASPAMELGFAAQHAELDPEMTGRELLDLFAALAGVRADERRTDVARAIESFALGAFVDTWVGRMSGGMRRRVHLAISTLGSPAMWLLDEPTTGLDPAGRALLEGAMAARTRQGASVVLATHELGFAERVAQHVVFLASGANAHEGAMRDILEEYGSLDRAYEAVVGDTAPAESSLRAGHGGGGGGRRRRHA